MFYGLTLDEEQEHFRDCIWDKNVRVIVCDAKAGTGKTTVAVGTANLLVQYGLYDGIVYIISPTQEQIQGYLPGDQVAKSAPYMEPLHDALITIGVNPNTVIVSEADMNSVKRGDAYVECMPHTYMRGTNLQNKIVILDESQNYYLDSLLKVITRVHDSCKLIIIGHDKQCDIYKHPDRSGFVPYMDYFRDANDDRVKICELHTNHRGWISTYADGIYDWLEDKLRKDRKD